MGVCVLVGETSPKKEKKMNKGKRLVKEVNRREGLGIRPVLLYAGRDA